MSWGEWSSRCGSILPLAFGDDVPLGPTLAPGVSGNFDLQITMTVQNVSNSSVVPQFNVLIVNEGVMMVVNTQVLVNSNVLTQQDVFDAKNKDPVPYKPARNFYGAGSGGSFFDDIGSFFRSIVRPALDVGKVVSAVAAPELLPALDIAGRIGSAVGLGPQGFRQRGGALIGGNQLRMLR